MFHLHCHSTYSMLDGYGTPEQYVSRIMELGMSGMAVTDHGNIFAHRTFAKVFAKAGKPGWAAIIPFYNDSVLIDICGLPVIYKYYLWAGIASARDPQPQNAAGGHVSDGPCQNHDHD